MLVRHVLPLVVLWAAARVGAGEQQPSGRSQDLVEVLRRVISEGNSEIRPLMDRLAGQVERLDARLVIFDTRLNGIESRLIAQDAKQSSLDARLDGLVSLDRSTNDDLDARLDEMASRIDSIYKENSARLEEIEARIDTDINGVRSSFDQLVNRVTSESNELTLRLNEVGRGVYSTKTKLTSRLDQLVSRVDSENAELGSRLDELVSQSNSSDVELISRLDNLTSLVDVRARLLTRDCSELPEGSQSGTYLIQPGLDRSGPPVAAFCDQDTDGGGWIVIQRRADIRPHQNFNLTWAAYREGFGSLGNEFWWGLENLWRLTGPRDRQYELRVDLEDFEGGRRQAVYRQFRVASEADGYRLSVGEYSGDAGDSLAYNSGWRFSTWDRDQDGSSGHCAQERGGGWWFDYCHNAHLNGHYLSGGRVDSKGINWYHWKSHYSMKSAEMKVRPVSTD